MPFPLKVSENGGKVSLGKISMEQVFLNIAGRVLLFILLGGNWIFPQGDYMKGLSFFKQKEYRQAIDEFEPLVKKYPDYESGHRILGLSYLQLREYEHAISELQQALQLKQTAVETYLGLAQAYYNLHRFEEAISILIQAFPYTQSPKDRYDLLRLRGSASYNHQQYEKAASDFEKAAEIHRITPQDLLQLGLAHYHLNNLELAERYLQLVLEYDSEQDEAIRFLSMMSYQKGIQQIENGHYREATQTISIYTAKFPENAEAWFNLGLAYLFSGNLVEAEKAFLQNISLKSQNRGKSFNRLGYICEKTNQYKRALDYYKKAYELTGTSENKLSVDRIKLRLEQGS